MDKAKTELIRLQVARMKEEKAGRETVQHVEIIQQQLEPVTSSQNIGPL